MFKKYIIGITSLTVFLFSFSLATNAVAGTTVGVDGTSVTTSEGTIKITVNTIGGSITSSPSQTFYFDNNFGIDSVTTNGISESVGFGSFVLSTVPMNGGPYHVFPSAGQPTPNWEFVDSYCTDMGNSNNSPTPGLINILDGSVIDCVFNYRGTTSTQNGNLKVIKNRMGSNRDDDFSFMSQDGISPFSLNSANGYTSEQNLPVGTYSMAETTAPGWTFHDISCTSNDPSAVPSNDINVIPITANFTTTCIVSNQYDVAVNNNPGTLIILKSVPTNSPAEVFNYSVAGTSAFGWNGIINTNYSFSNSTSLPAGTYNIAEQFSNSSGWTNTSATCGGPEIFTQINGSGGNLSNVVVVPGGVTVCVFYNVYGITTGTINVHTTAVGGSEIFHFQTYSTQSPINFDINTAQSNVYSLTNLQSGVLWTVDQINIPSGWVQTGNTCVGISVIPGQSQDCYITNTLGASKIHVIGQTAGGEDDLFLFNVYKNAASPLLSTFSIITQGGVGSYDLLVTPDQPYPFIGQILPNGWSSTNLSCVDSSGTPLCGQFAWVYGSAYQTAQCLNFTHTARASKTITCTFTNQKNITAPLETGSLQIIKYTNGGDATQSYPFGYSISSIPVTLNVNGNNFGSIVTPITAGVYDIKESIIPSGWVLDVDALNQPYCVDKNGFKTGAFDSVTQTIKNVTVEAVAGIPTTCYFTNVFSASGSGSGTLKIIKNTIGGDEAFSYSLGKIGMTDIFQSLYASTANGSGSVSQSLTAGTYYIQEDSTLATNGWSFISMECKKQDGTITGTTPYYSGGDSKIGVEIIANQTTTCTYTNQKNGVTSATALIIKKKAIGGDGTFLFSATLQNNSGGVYNNAALSITTVNGVGLSAPISATPDSTQDTSFTIQEFGLANWQHASITCDKGTFVITPPLGGDPHGNWIASGTIPASQTTTCTFENTKTTGTAKMIIKKKAIGGDGTDSFRYDVYNNIGISMVPDSSFNVNANIKDTSNPSIANRYTGSYELTINSGDPYPYVHEVIPANSKWQLKSLMCVNQAGVATCNSGQDADGTPNCLGSASAKAGEVITCTFENIKTTDAILKIIKKATGGNSPETFHYNLYQNSLSANPYSPATLDIRANIRDSGNQALYTGSTTLTIPIGEPYPFIQEDIALNAGWTLNSIVCLQKDGITPFCSQGVDVNGNPICIANASAQSGDEITCTFENSKSVDVGSGSSGGSGVDNGKNEEGNVDIPHLDLEYLFQ